MDTTSISYRKKRGKKVGLNFGTFRAIATVEESGLMRVDLQQYPASYVRSIKRLRSRCDCGAPFQLLWYFFDQEEKTFDPVPMAGTCTRRQCWPYMLSDQEKEDWIREIKEQRA